MQEHPYNNIVIFGKCYKVTQLHYRNTAANISPWVGCHFQEIIYAKTHPSCNQQQKPPLPPPQGKKTTPSSHSIHGEKKTHCLVAYVSPVN